MTKFLFVILLYSFTCLATNLNCQNQLKLDTTKPDCLLHCVSSAIDKQIRNCSDYCVSLCKVPLLKQLIFNVSSFYPGLTKTERALSALYPKNTWQAYQLTWRAEKLCRKLFKISRSHDASDACRHFVWASLLYQRLGLEFSKKILYAHEKDPKQTKDEKTMDLANNHLGLITAQKLEKNQNLNDTSILQAFKEHLQKGDLLC